MDTNSVAQILTAIGMLERQIATLAGKVEKTCDKCRSKDEALAAKDKTITSLRAEVNELRLRDKGDV